MAFKPEVTENVAFLGDEARAIVEQEIDRSRALDTKSGGLLAASLALLAGALTFATKISDLDGGRGAKTVWAVVLVLAFLLSLAAGALAVWAIRPRAVRIAVHVDDMKKWVTPRILERDPTEVRGMLLYGSVIAVGDARTINEAKARRLAHAFYAFSAALICLIAAGVAVAVHTAVYADRHVERGSRNRACRVLRPRVQPSGGVHARGPRHAHVRAAPTRCLAP